MVQITTDIGNLDKEQREALAGFILAFPSRQAALLDFQAVGRGLRAASESLTVTELADESPEAAFTAPDVSKLDASGLPWDERIHSGNHEFTKDGVWRRRRGVDDAAVATVEAELRGKPTTLPPPPPAAILPPPPPVDAGLAVVTVESQLAPVASSFSADQAGYIALVKWANEMKLAGKLSVEEIVTACSASGLSGFPELAKNFALIPQIQSIILMLTNGR